MSRLAASEHHLSVSSQPQALNALVFLYDSVLYHPYHFWITIITGDVNSCD
ncbi:MAG: hypothetical protein AB7V33_00870 [Halothiobacillus sp.]